ncbi:MAG: DNA polymerase I [Sediminibacterium sp.]|nr:DNA polymerase I [Sediminibacterium sp.]
MSKKLYLLDALALIYRAYYALIRNPRITSTGINTNAQFGFTNTLLEIIKKENPSHIAVCFDTHAPTERHTDFTDYKANREEAPEDLLSSLPHIKAIIEGFNIPVVECDGYEADDVIGTLAWQAAWKPPAFGNEREILDAEKIKAKWDIARVDQVIDMLGLMGDAADNIPGIPGVGEKTAAKLLKEYDTLEGVLANADKIKGAMGEKVRAGKESAIMSKKLATIITNVPVQFHEEDYKLTEKNIPALTEIFNLLEFKTLGKRILGGDFEEKTRTASDERKKIDTEDKQVDLFGNEVKPAKEKTIKTKTIVLDSEKGTQEVLEPNDETEEEDAVASDGEAGAIVVNKNIGNTPHQYEAVVGDAAIQDLVKTLLQQKEICIDTETTGIDANNVELVGLSFSFKEHTGYYVPVANDGEGKDGAKHILSLFKKLFDQEDITWIGQNLKYDFLVLKWYGVQLKGKTFDTMLAHYVIEPEGRRSMDLLSGQYLGYEPVSIESIIGKKGKNQGSMRDASLEQIKEYAAEDADITLQLKHCLAPLILKKEVSKVFNEVENPLMPVLVDMEFEGVKVDTDFLNEYSKVLEVEAKESEEKVYAAAGVRFNLALQKMAAKHKIVDDILNFRELTKLKSTYVDAIPELINPRTGRIHTSYAQAVAVTGRLSSTNPNLQNIPVRTDRGKEIRKAFIPRDPSRILVSADYSQIELRVVAAISGDPNMCEAFKLGKDIHTATAAKVYGVDEADVTKEMRYKAKSVNFGIIYGQGAFGLAENLGISRTEAKEIIDNYKKEFPNIQKYMDQQINQAKELGYVETLMGRKRWLRDINSSNFTVRGFAERNAINSPIQGSAADMIKLAMIKIHNAMKAKTWESKMILQVHDELIFDATEKELPALKELILSCMTTAMELPNGVPVEAELGTGKNWLEAH